MAGIQSGQALRSCRLPQEVQLVGEGPAAVQGRVPSLLNRSGIAVLFAPAALRNRKKALLVVQPQTKIEFSPRHLLAKAGAQLALVVLVVFDVAVGLLGRLVLVS